MRLSPNNHTDTVPTLEGKGNRFSLTMPALNHRVFESAPVVWEKRKPPDDKSGNHLTPKISGVEGRSRTYTGARLLVPSNVIESEGQIQ